MRKWMDLFEAAQDPTALVHQVAEELLADAGCTPEEFNNGRCMEFSDELERRDPRFHSYELGNFYNHPEGSDCSEATGFGEKWLAHHPEWVPPHGLTWQDLYYHYGFDWTGTHMWAWCDTNRLCYDIEALDGVLNLFDLPFFKRMIAHFQSIRG